MATAFNLGDLGGYSSRTRRYHYERDIQSHEQKAVSGVS